ncbi:protein transporter [Schizopora paradoxa]|uniref:Mitochondrial import inner membrane translocase subunit TIM16 n=1 Tax=Schizopora paradoxa TaxID=27342 RepID=A0A0H2S8P0_9AGAM|nr:protein transporter [Schizopora paradoxa]
MSSPKAIVQIVVLGAQIFGKALLAAGRQAAKNAQSRPQAVLQNEAAGVGNATSGSLTDKLTREHRMTVDEARLILNLKKEDPIEHTLRNYEHLFKANSPPPPPEKPVAGRAKAAYHSHYLQSKVVRAKERLDAEVKVAVDGDAASTSPAEAQHPTSPPPP